MEGGGHSLLLHIIYTVFTCSFISNSDPHILNKIVILQPESLLAFTCNALLGQQVIQPGYEPSKHRSRILPYYTNLLSQHMVCYIESRDGFYHSICLH